MLTKAYAAGKKFIKKKMEVSYRAIGPSFRLHNNRPTITADDKILFTTTK